MGKATGYGDDCRASAADRRFAPESEVDGVKVHGERKLLGLVNVIVPACSGSTESVRVYTGRNGDSLLVAVGEAMEEVVFGIQRLIFFLEFRIRGSRGGILLVPGSIKYYLRVVVADTTAARAIAKGYQEHVNFRV